MQSPPPQCTGFPLLRVYLHCNSSPVSAKPNPVTLTSVVPSFDTILGTKSITKAS